MPPGPTWIVRPPLGDCTAVNRLAPVPVSATVPDHPAGMPPMSHSLVPPEMGAWLIGACVHVSVGPLGGLLMITVTESWAACAAPALRIAASVSARISFGMVVPSGDGGG